MTTIGKLFVLVNLALSLVMATLAFGVYANGIDWSTNAAKGDQPAGRSVAMKAEIDNLTKGINLSYDTWREANKELLTREEVRRSARRQYVVELAKLEANAGTASVVSIEKSTATQLQLVPAEEAPGVPLQAIGVYRERQRQVRAENERIRKELDAKVKEDIELTNQLTGDPERKTKGLRQLLTEERAKQEGIIAETGIEEGLRINREVESELILKRLEAINERVRDLEAFLKLKDGKAIEDKGAGK